MHAPLLDPGGVLDACLRASRAAAFRPLETVGFPLDPALRDILLSTTIRISGLHHAACILATPGSVPPLAETHAGSLLTCWLGFRQVGLEPFPVLTHWATTTNFMGLRPIPRFRAYLGATSAMLGFMVVGLPPRPLDGHTGTVLPTAGATRSCTPRSCCLWVFHRGLSPKESRSLH
jgi:hypothetical protein